MPRVARIKKSETGVYHIIERGNEKKDIFNDEEDRRRFLEIIEHNRQKYGFKVYAYCLMSNHIHLLIGCNGADISQVMKSINVSYVIYFNRKYKRCGHLFQDRFKSEYIDTDEYLLEVSRYIHLNPVSAGLVKSEGLASYPWSSFTNFINEAAITDIKVDVEYILMMFSKKTANAKKRYLEYVMREEPNAINKFKISEDTRINTAEVIAGSSKINVQEYIQKKAEEHNITYEELVCKNSKHKAIRTEIIKEIRRTTSLSLREIGRFFGISESAISKILKNN